MTKHDRRAAAVSAAAVAAAAAAVAATAARSLALLPAETLTAVAAHLARPVVTEVDWAAGVLTVTARAAELPYADILAEVAAEPDDWPDPPWADCEGYEHRVVPAEALKGYNDAYAFPRRGQGRRVVVVDPARVEAWGAYAYHGASKQVNAEARAANLASTRRQIAEWYRDGWQYWWVRGEYLGAQASLGRVEEASIDEVRAELADEIAGDLEGRGYVIVGRPVRDRRAECRSRFQHQLTGEAYWTPRRQPLP